MDEGEKSYISTSTTNQSTDIEVKTSPKKKLKIQTEGLTIQIPASYITANSNSATPLPSSMTAQSASTPLFRASNKKQLENVAYIRKIVYGSYSETLKPEDNAPEGHTHKWKIFLEGFEGADITSWCKQVVFHLHESFKEPKRTFNEPPFVVNEYGWGEFEIAIEIFFMDPKLKPIKFFHLLKLYPIVDPTSPEKSPIPKPVLYEKYEELLFLHPLTPMMLTIFQAEEETPIDKQENCISKMTAKDEEKEQEKIQNAKDKIDQMIEEQIEKKQKLEKLLLEAKKEYYKLKSSLKIPGTPLSSHAQTPLPKTRSATHLEQ